MKLAILCFILGCIALYIAQRGGLSRIARGRKYKSGTGWCVWRWTDVRSEYILRLHLVKTPWFAVCLHWIQKPDPEPWLHDHPVSFFSLILRGKYAELRRTMDSLSPEYRVHTWFNFIRADQNDRHKIIFCRRNTLTLCFMGPKTREWGYHTHRGWIHWKEYERQLKEFEADMQERDFLWKKLDAEATKLGDAFKAMYNGKIFLDEEVRKIDTREVADFKPEPLTGPITKDEP